MYEGAGITEIFYSVEGRPDLDLVVHRVCGHQIGDVKTGAVYSEKHVIHPEGTLEVLYLAGEGVLETRNSDGSIGQVSFPKGIKIQKNEIEVQDGDEIVWNVSKGKELVYLTLQKKHEEN